jgi:hypothetical protein
VTETLHDTGAIPLPPADILATFEEHLLATGRVRLDLATLWDLWNRADAAWAGTWAARPRLRHALDRLHEQSIIALPSPTGKLWDGARPQLPQRIDFPANRRTPAPDHSADEPWSPAMAWTPGWIRTAHPPRRLRDDAILINRWLLATLGRQPARVAREERSLHIFNNEKRLAELAAGAMFDTDQRLTLDTLSCDPPLGALRAARITDHGPVLVVENKSTFDSALRALRTDPEPGYAAVVFGSGDAISATIHDLAHLDDLLGVYATRFDYAGDVDVAGIEAAESFATCAGAAGLPWSMAHKLWAAVAASPPTGPDQTSDTTYLASALSAAQTLQLPLQVATRLREGMRVPQERIDRHAFAKTDWWRPNTPE